MWRATSEHFGSSGPIYLLMLGLACMAFSARGPSNITAPFRRRLLMAVGRSLVCVSVSILLMLPLAVILLIGGPIGLIALAFSAIYWSSLPLWRYDQPDIEAEERAVRDKETFKIQEELRKKRS